ncbi:MAG: hypothetical protein IT580_00060 [Verrucomicrobiales bacterium]|nr:hypothetical protein [Verrucomicrobiales bacterium]
MTHPPALLARTPAARPQWPTCIRFVGRAAVLTMLWISTPAATLHGLPSAPPTITAQSGSFEVREGTPIALFVEATGTAPLTYQWYSNDPYIVGIPDYAIRGANEPHLNFIAVRNSRATNYWCEVRDPSGLGAESSPMHITVRPAAGPYITLDPAPQQGDFLRLYTLFVDVAGGEAPHLQWLRNGLPIPGATLPSLTLSAHGFACCEDLALYAVEVFDDFGHTNRSAETEARRYNTVDLRIIRDPESVLTQPGATVTFTAEVWVPKSDLGKVEYQWLHNGSPHRTTQEPSLTLTQVTASDLGSYSGRVWGPTSMLTAESNAARLDFALPRLIVDTTQTVSRLAGQPGVAGDRSGPALAAHLNTPRGGSFDAQGDFVFADSGNHRIKRLTRSGDLQTVAGEGLPGLLDGPAERSRFRSPTAVVANANGELFVADSGNHAIRRIDRAGVVSTVAGTGAPGGARGVGQSASFSFPTDLAFAKDGSLFVVEPVGHSVRQLAVDGLVTRWAGARVAGWLDGQGTASRLHTPSAIALDSNGFQYVAEQGNPCIRLIDPEGGVSTRFRFHGWGYVDGPVAQAELRTVESIATDASGRLLVADTGNHAIRRLSPDGEVTQVTTLAGTGSPGSADGPVATASFSSPSGVAIAPDGSVYVTDTGNHMIRRIGPHSGLRLSFGRATPSGPVTLSWPSGILQSAPTPLGAWEDLPAATSPHAPSTALQQLFFRVRTE